MHAQCIVVGQSSFRQKGALKAWFPMQNFRRHSPARQKQALWMILMQLIAATIKQMLLATFDQNQK